MQVSTYVNNLYGSLQRVFCSAYIIVVALICRSSAKPRFWTGELFGAMHYYNMRYYSRCVVVHVALNLRAVLKLSRCPLKWSLLTHLHRM